MPLQFTKMEGTGNDFVVIDAREHPIALSPTQIRQLSARKTGIGCDQLLLIERAASRDNTLSYRIYNADGQEVQQCGNGARALAAYAGACLPAGAAIRMESLGGLVQAHILDDGQVRVNMGTPDFTPSALPFTVLAQATEYVLDIGAHCVEFGAVSIGNPHVVIPVGDVDTAPVNEIGPMLQQHAAFPESVNVGFAQIVSTDTLRLRVYERGVGETLACGTGACAAAAVAQQLGLVGQQVKIVARGGELLVTWAGDGQNIWLSGPCNRVYEGLIDL